MTGTRLLAPLALLLALACSSPPRDDTVHTTLPPGVVARVGTTDIPAATVARVAAAQGVSLPAAAERAISDALLAGALSSDPGRPGVAVATRAAHARALVESVQLATAGPVSDEEIARLTAERWTELDRPVAVRTTHAVALVKQPQDDAGARELAEHVARDVAGIRDTQTFIERANELAGGPIELRVERLPPVVLDGRTIQPGAKEQGHLDAAFTAAAHAIASEGDHSPVVKTTFGYHVILLEERMPELRMPLAERRKLLEPLALARRGERELAALSPALRAATAIEVARDAEQLTAEITVDP